jgi:hypothetical protein
MKQMKILLSFILLGAIVCKKNATISLFMNGTSNKYLPDELLDTYHEYSILEDYNNTCNIETYIESNPVEKIKQKIKDSKCIPDYKSFISILENGWLDLGKELVVNHYLPNSIDPTIPLYSYINKQEGKVKYLDNINKEHKFEKLNLNYEFESNDNSVSFRAKLPDHGYVLEYYSVFCYKDMFKLNAVFKTRNKMYKFSDSRTFYDGIDGDCEHNFNHFTHQVEVKFNKLNKFKRWESLFR